MRFSSSKKGVISFIFSKFAFLIFGIVIAATFFYLISVQHDIQGLNKIARTSDSISNIAGMVSASQFEVWTIYETKTDSKIEIKNESFILHSKNKLKRGFLFPINAESSNNNISISCLNISNTNNTVIKECQ